MLIVDILPSLSKRPSGDIDQLHSHYDYRYGYELFPPLWPGYTGKTTLAKDAAQWIHAFFSVLGSSCICEIRIVAGLKHGSTEATKNFPHLSVDSYR